MPTDYAIKNGRTVMNVSLWNGTGAAQSISNADIGTLGFKPDFVWSKCRNDTFGHCIDDSVRGAALTLQPQVTSAEVNEGTAGLVAFNSNGFNIGGGSGGWNVSAKTYAAWQFQAGAGTSSSNTNGSITSTVSVNQAAGFSIVTYMGNNSSASVGHGLGVAPKLVITKSRNSGTWNWLVNIGAITGTQGDYLYLNATQGKLNSSNVLNGNSTVLPLLTSPENNENGTTFVSYCWAEVPGFSKFGTYNGNGSSDGVFVYTGFRPKCILIKNIGNASDWTILDSSRGAYNLNNNELNPNATAAETNYNTADFLSNGFKLRSAYGNTNGNGYGYIYAAFAENPFKYANAR